MALAERARWVVVVRAYSRQLIPYLAVKSNLAGRRKSDRLSFAIEGGMRGISGNPSPPDFQPPRHVLQASSATSDRYKSSPGTVICSGVALTPPPPSPLDKSRYGKSAKRINVAVTRSLHP